MHEADHAYSIWSTWCLHRLTTDVPSIAYVMNWQKYFCMQLGFVEFSPRIWIVVFFYFYLSVSC